MKAFDGVTVSKDELGGVEIDKSPEDLADEREYQELMKRNSLFDEITFALYESRFMAPIIALLGILLAYHLTIAPHQTYVDKTEKLNINLADIRPVLSDHEQSVLRRKLLYSETHLKLPLNDDLIHFKFQQRADMYGHFRLPTMFFTGVTFGLTWQNPHDLYFSAQNTLGYKDIKHDLLTMYPKPTSIMKRVQTYENYTEIIEDGVAVFFSYEDLEKQGRLSSDKLLPFKRVQEDILKIARRHKQVYIIAWYPHQFGHDVSDDKEDKYKHYSIIQQIIPTRTGLNGIKSTAAVWLTAINETAPQEIAAVKAFW